MESRYEDVMADQIFIIPSKNDNPVYIKDRDGNLLILQRGRWRKVEPYVAEQISEDTRIIIPKLPFTIHYFLKEFNVFREFFRLLMNFDG